MSTATLPAPTASPTRPPDPTSPLRRFVGVVARPQSYRNIAYVLVGLLLGTIWFSILITAVAIGVSLLVVALVGVPVLLGTWYLTRLFANVERRTADILLGHDLALGPMTGPAGSNLWARLRAMSRERARWRELGYLMLRFPIGIATSIATITALATPGLVAYAPFAARHGHHQPFGDWALSDTMHDAASSPWSWLLVPLGLVLFIPAFHLVNAIATACGHWTTRWLDGDATIPAATAISSHPSAPRG